MSRAGASRAFAAIAVLATLGGGGAAAGAATPAAETAIRSADHPGFGRIVIDTNAATEYTLKQEGDHVVVHLQNNIPLGAPPPRPRNVVGISIEGSTIDLTLQSGARLRPSRVGGRVILDMVDDGSATATPGPSKPLQNPRPHPSLSMASSPELGGRSTGDSAPVVSAPVVSAPVASTPAPAAPASAAPVPVEARPLSPPQAAQQPAPNGPGEMTEPTPPGRDVLPENEGPIGLRARRTRLPKEMDGTAFLVPFDSTTGAAAFQSGDSTYVVFDERRPVDMAALTADPVFGSSSVQLLPTGTLVRIPHPAALSIALTQMQQGWRIAALASTPKQEPIVTSAADGRINLAAEQPSEVVNIADPDTGATLLVGTQHRPGQGVRLARRSSEFILRPTLQGVVVEALSDAIALKPTPTGFSLSGPATGLALSPSTDATAELIDAAHLTRRLNFSTVPADTLRRLAITQFDDAASSPPLSRAPKHRAAAETFLALGLSAEAESLLHMASDQDPKEATSADTEALSAIAALLAGRPDESAGLMDPKLSGTDEIELWRAVRQAMQDEGSPRAAAVFATTAPLVFRYPDAIREHILPLIAETMILGGEIKPAALLLADRKDDPKLAYARALLSNAKGKSDQALAMLDRLANGHDQFDRARAAVRAVELRLGAGALDKTQAADALDKLLYAWRGDARELALRERVAELRGQTGGWRVALSILRQAATDFPDQAAPISDRLKDTFAAMIRDQDARPTSPIEFVAMLEENTDLARDSSDSEAVEQPLADRLLALDLPGRAKPVFDKLMNQAKSPVAKARFGASLATLDSREGDDAGAISALDASEGSDLPPDLSEQRLILRAGSTARKGDPAGAAAMLASTRTVRATEARAEILETASDWAGAEQAWSDCVAMTLPDSGMLDEPQTRTMLRLATAAARAGHDERLGVLRDTYGPRVGAGPLGDMFRLLTAEPIRTSTDIQRSQREISLAASLPTDLKALQAGGATR
jgi:hypothetical protein